jgi:AraC-like DNA-binding protein
VEHRLRTARPGRVAVLAPQLDELTVRIHQPQAYTAAVRQAVLDRLGREPITATTTARLLVVSERTLHRRLAAEGTSLRRLLDETRRALAIELLDERQHPVKEVASALGFASARSLHRAYRRWTGTTPRGRSSSVAG